MTYRTSHKEKYDEKKEQLINAIEAFDEQLSERLSVHERDNWNENYLLSLNELRKQLTKFKLKLLLK